MKKILIDIALVLFLLFISTLAEAGYSFQTLSQSTIILKMDEINEQIIEARKASQKGMGSDRLTQIKEQAIEVLKRVASRVLQQKEEVSTSAMVFCSSQTIEVMP